MRNLAVLLFCLVGAAASAGQPAFRSVEWGMSVSEVKNVEKSSRLITDRDDVLVYEVSLAGRQCNLVYRFVHRGPPSLLYSLISGAYRLDSSSAHEHLAAFDDFCKILSSKYGKPDVTEEEWSAEFRVGGDKARRIAAEDAILIGVLTRWRSWLTPTANITCRIGPALLRHRAPQLELQYADPKIVVSDPKQDTSGF
jgi:hypothetical protein